MAQTAQTSDLPRPRIRSREEIEETYKQIVAGDPKEGPALVDTHRRLILLLDKMIERGWKRRR
jgi:hypothetical protein